MNVAKNWLRSLGDRLRRLNRKIRRRRQRSLWIARHEREKRRDIRRVMKADREWDGGFMLAYIRLKLKWMLEYYDGPASDIDHYSDAWLLMHDQIGEAYALACRLDDYFMGVPSDRPIYGDDATCEELDKLTFEEDQKRRIAGGKKEDADTLRLFTLMGTHLNGWWD